MNEINRSRRILDLRFSMDHKAMTAVLEELSSRYPFLSLAVIGQTILGKPIYMIRLGDGAEKQKSVLYIGAHHGMEWITASLLLRFVNEYCELLKSDGIAEGIRAKHLYEGRTVCVVPMLNPDGVDYAIHGVSDENPLRERLVRMNGGSEDFSHWQANARGVDLNHNYNAGFADYKKIEAELEIGDGAPTRFSGSAPESEPETAYLCNYLRFNDPFDGVLTLHTQGEEIYYKSGEVTVPESERLAKYLSRACGYRLSVPEGPAAYGGFTDWYIREFGKPSFTLECGTGSNPLPVAQLPMMYLRLRRALFGFPMQV